MLLQKTLLNVEGLGLQLDPELDLWKTAKPWLERWMTEQVGWRGFLKSLHTEAPNYATLLPQLPRVLNRYLVNDGATYSAEMLHRILEQQKRYNTLLAIICVLLLGLFVWGFFNFHMS